MKSRVFLPALLIVMSSIAAKATPLISGNIYDNAMQGQAVLGYTGTDVWNHPTLNNASTGALVNSAGTTTSVILTSSNWFISADNSTAPQPIGDGPLDGPTPTNPLAPDLFTDYGISAPYNNPDKGTGPDYASSDLDFTGLAANRVYEVVLYTRNQPGADGREFTVTTTGVSGTFSETLVDAESPTFTSTLDSTESSYYGNPTYDGNYIKLIVKSDGSGDLVLALNDQQGGGPTPGDLGTGGEFDLSGFQLTPEPSTYALMLGGMGMLFFLARKRRQSVTASL